MTKNQQSKPQNEHGQQNQEPKEDQNPSDPRNRDFKDQKVEHNTQRDKQPTR
jgi:hypothetical protein